MRVVCKMGRKVLDAAGAMVKPGVTTEEIDIEVHRMCMEMNAYPSPLNYNYFPKSKYFLRLTLANMCQNFIQIGEVVFNSLCLLAI